MEVVMVNHFGIWGKVMAYRPKFTEGKIETRLSLVGTRVELRSFFPKSLTELRLGFVAKTVCLTLSHCWG